MEYSAVEIFINQLEELARARAKNRHVQNKRRKLPGAFSSAGAGGLGLYFRLGRDNRAVCARLDGLIAIFLRGSAWIQDFRNTEGDHVNYPLN